MFTLSLLLSVLQLISCDNFNTHSSTTGVSTAKVVDSATIKRDSILRQDSLIALKKLKYDSTTRFIYMTFDDGPLAPTPFLNQIILEKQIQMDAFVVGKHAFSNPQFMKHLDALKANSLIEVVNHSYSHANGRYKNFYSAPQTAAEDMLGNQTKLGLTKKIIRMPGRDIWALDNKSFGLRENGGKTAAILHDNGYKVYGWDVEWEHSGKTAAPKKSPQAMLAIIDTLFANGSMLTKNHLVFLGHDEMLGSEKARNDLRTMIDSLKSRGYIFQHISDYPD